MITNKTSIFIDEVYDDLARETNLLITYKNINSFAESKDDLDFGDRHVLDIHPGATEIDSDLEQEYKKVVQVKAY